MNNTPPEVIEGAEVMVSFDVNSRRKSWSAPCRILKVMDDGRLKVKLLVDRKFKYRGPVQNYVRYISADRVIN